ncbi:class I SAM-dependent methyltransferase [Piscinibacter sp. XHJ-5]|uniref:class I SAM-dependent methyltransferase n=1 Tax=Piscinibacter sp. XHJ-5 TaxID=3037797 RepID=UPI0024532BEA|nr:class I SAM-dependent methyltransferase [Piscinibacter sp. XHJ-5]
MSDGLDLQAPGEASSGLRSLGRADPRADAAWRSMVAAASQAYRRTDGHASRFARSKLRRDRVFRHVLEQGLIEPGATVLDIGCGQGLLASLLRAAGDAARSGRWPATWAAPPVGATLIGFDVRSRDIARAASMMDPAATFILDDMRGASFPGCDVAVFFDTLHYIAIDEQDEVLRRVRGALRPGGVVLLRVGDTSASLRYRLGVEIDRVTRWLLGGGYASLHGRTLPAWTASLSGLGFDVHSCPMNGRPPFANRLLVARLPHPGRAPSPANGSGPG